MWGFSKQISLDNCSFYLNNAYLPYLLSYLFVLLSSFPWLYYFFVEQFLMRYCFVFFQDGRIDYGEFVAMMQKGNAGIGRRTMRNSVNLSMRDGTGVRQLLTSLLCAGTFIFVYLIHPPFPILSKYRETWWVAHLLGQHLVLS